MAGSGPRDAAGAPAIELSAHEEQLVEIARAEALLNQRDPDAAAQVVRAQLVHQATERGRRERAAKIEAAATKAERRRRRRKIAGVASVVLVGLAGIPIARVMLRENDREEAVRAQLAALGKPAISLGFGVEKDWIEVPPAGVEIQIQHDTCAALVATREGGEGPLPFEVERTGAPEIKAAAGAVFCSCEGETVRVKPAEAGGARRALRWMAASIGAVGGIQVLAAQPAAGFQVTTDGAGEACADAGFRAWSAIAGHGDVSALDAARPGITQDLVADGFEPAGLFEGDHPFGVLRGKQGRCYVAAPEPGKVEIALHAADGTHLVEKAAGAIAWCNHATDAAYALWRAAKGSPPVVVLSAPADRVGGVGGARAAALRHGYREVQAALLPEEMSKDARASLLAATVPAASIQESDSAGLPGKGESTAVAFALRDKGVMLPGETPPAAYGCAPDADPGLALRASLCAQARPQPWHPGGDQKLLGGAEGRRPYWLDVFNDVTDEGALRAAAALMLFAQRLTLLGYEPTTSDGVKDTPEGAVISARPGKGEVIAVGISRTKPYLVPLTDGPKWKLDGPLRVITVAPGAPRTLRGDARLSPDPKARRVVAFRR